uniref:Uncharacterized protein n=1 Tax=Moorena producens (strain JHB) TaxID=1454205 RepID=A0A1D9G2R8_MOOP1
MLDTSNKTNCVREAWPKANRPLVAEQLTQQLIRGVMTIIPVSLDKITILVSNGKMALLNGDRTIAELRMNSFVGFTWEPKQQQKKAMLMCA